MEQFAEPEPGGRAAPGSVPAGVVGILKATKPWVRFLSVLGFVGCGLLVIVGIVMGAAGALSEELGAAGPLLALLYLALAVLYFFPALFLFRYANAIEGLVTSSSGSSLENALTQQHKFWRFVGVLAIVLICVYFLVLLGTAIIALAD